MIADKETQSVFIAKLKTMNSITFESRLKVMAQNHLELFDTYVPEWQSKIKKIVATRNFYTHYSKGQYDSYPDANDIGDCVDFLKMLIELEVLYCCGLSGDVLHQNALKCSDYGWYFRNQKNVEVQ